MVAGLSFFTSERSNKNSGAKRCGHRAILPNGPCVGKKRVAPRVDSHRCPPCMNGLGAANVMPRPPIPAICTDEHRRADFAPKILQKSGKQKNCTRHVMRKPT